MHDANDSHLNKNPHSSIFLKNETKFEINVVPVLQIESKNQVRGACMKKFPMRFITIAEK